MIHIARNMEQEAKCKLFIHHVAQPINKKEKFFNRRLVKVINILI